MLGITVSNPMHMAIVQPVGLNEQTGLPSLDTITLIESRYGEDIAGTEYGKVINTRTLGDLGDLDWAIVRLTVSN